MTVLICDWRRVLLRLALVCGYLLVLCFGAAGAAEARLELRYLRAQGDVELSVERSLRDSRLLDDTVDFLNEMMVFAEPLVLRMGAEDGPLFDPQQSFIDIPYGFVREVEGRFEAANYHETGVSPRQAADDALLHTVLHELAHALVSMNALPVVGREEDAADALAVVLLIENFESGQEIAISAAELFDIETEDQALTEADFWDEHSLGVQRYYATLCLVYGSDAAQYEDLRRHLGFSDERAEFCLEEYEIMSRNWLKLLSPWLRD